MRTAAAAATVAFTLAFCSTAQAEQKWYEGGTLHKATKATWEKATPANQLATCADFVSLVWTKKLLRPDLASKIRSMDDMKPFADEMAAWITLSYQFGNGTKSTDAGSMAAIFMTEKKWLK